MTELLGRAARGRSLSVALLWWCLALWAALIDGFEASVYLNQWAVEILGGPEVADAVAADYGFRNLGQIGSLENYYLFEHRKLVKRSANPSRHHHVSLERAPQVLWVQQQTVKRRVKRDYRLDSDRWKPKLTDPFWPEMWYLNQGAKGGHDMNVLGAWRLGYTGKGVVVTILDDGIEHTHADLNQNYDPDASYDINDSDNDPNPRYDKADENRHGTRCAGEVAAVANNSFCGVGVAFQARIGGVRMLDGDVSDVVEAEALSLNPQHIDIYSASWGPEDNGKLVDGPGKLAKEAFEKGVLKGRNGKGSIYVWASGNGGSVSDSCSCDGYANSIYTLSVSSTSEFGAKPWYLEECSSILATTYSSGENYRERKIVTTDLHNRCIDNHTGTSASAPLAAGMCALALEANANLTWRDMQHIVLLTARSDPLRDAQWVTNAVGRPVSHRYGYGLMDGQAMVLLAEKWTTVPEQHICVTDIIKVNQHIEDRGISLTLETDGCKDMINEINYLEHVQAKVSLTYSRRGDLQIHLVSPNGTRSTLLPRRKYDYQVGDFKNWPFMSVFFWGEQPRGSWTLVIENIGPAQNSGVFEQWQLIMYGTKDDPVNLKDTSPIRPTFHQPIPTMSTELESSVTVMESKTSDLVTAAITKAKTRSTTSKRPTTTKKPKAELRTTTTATATNTTEKPMVELRTTTIKDKPKVQLKTTTKKPKSMVAKTTTHVTKHVTMKATVNATLGEASTKISVTADVGIKEPEETIMEGGLVTSEMPYVEVETSHMPYLHSPTVPTVTDTIHVPTPDTKDDKPVPYICDIECTDDGCYGPGPDDCMLCQHARLDGHCVNSCPNSTFYDSTSGDCFPCQPPCLECSESVEGDAVDCLSCIPGFFILQDGSLSNCVESCPPQHFSDSQNQKCVPCVSPNCLICSDNPLHCLSCMDNFELMTFYCMQTCKHSEFRDEDGSCQPCDVSCDMCFGPDAYDCQSCAAGLLQENNLCVANCSEGYYLEIMEEELACHMCHPSCSSCYGPEDYECFSCFHPLKLHRTSCVENCPPGHYEDNDAVCRFCHETCAVCIGPQDNDCLDCSSSRFYFDGRCVQNCTDGLYPVEMFNHLTGGMTNHCQLCHGTCQMCTGGSAVDCLQCFKGLVYSLGRCVAQCESHKFQEADICFECDVSCSSCYGPLSDHCLDCPDGNYLHGGQCLVECPHGFYQLDKHCLHCDMACDSCSDQGADNCITCSDDFVMRDGICIRLGLDWTLNCTEGQFYNAVEMVCSPCHGSCHECSGYGHDECVSCHGADVLHMETRRCLPCCSAVENALEVQDCCLCDLDMEFCTDIWNNILRGPPTLSSVDLRPVDVVTERVDLYTEVNEVNEDGFELETDEIEQLISTPAETSTSFPSFDSSEDLSFTPDITSIPTTSIVVMASLPPSQHSPTTRELASESSFVMSSSSIVPIMNMTQVKPAEVDDDLAILNSSQSSTFPATTGEDYTEPVSGFLSPSPWVVVLFLVLCLGTVCAITFIVIFCLLQAKANDKLCWSKRPYRPVPMFYRSTRHDRGHVVKADV